MKGYDRSRATLTGKPSYTTTFTDTLIPRAQGISARAIGNREISVNMADAEKTLDRRSLRIACDELLFWLKRQARLKIQRPFLLPTCEWADTLRRLVTAVPELAEVFAVEPEQMTFRAEIPLQERLEIEEFVHARFNPRLRTKE